MIQPTKTAYKPYENLRTVAVSWTPTGDIALINDKITRTSTEEYVIKIICSQIVERHPVWFFLLSLLLGRRKLRFPWQRRGN
jgi:hypothetical protein